MDDHVLPPAKPLPTRVIPPGAYADPAVFAAEMERIFRRSWIFVGFAERLAAENDFLTATVAGTPVLVRNVGGEIRAFRNVCSHRFALIHREACGRAKMVCPYHGWVYDRDGVPVGIPGNREFFGFDAEARRRLALPRYEAGVRGRFVFVRLEPGGPSLDAHLGAYGDLIDHLSELFTDPIDEARLPWAADWKIGVESVLEVYHVDATHPETFKPFTKKIWYCAYEKEHSRSTAHLSDGSARWWDGVAARLALPQSPLYRDYDHFFIFPNLAVGVTRGALMSVQTYDPVDAGSCVLHYRLFLGETAKPQTRGGPVRRAVEESLTGFNRKVLDEDRVVSESVNLGTKAMDRPALPGWCEERIHAFHAAYLDRMEEG